MDVRVVLEDEDVQRVTPTDSPGSAVVKNIPSNSDK